MSLFELIVVFGFVSFHNAPGTSNIPYGLIRHFYLTLIIANNTFLL